MDFSNIINEAANMVNKPIETFINMRDEAKANTIMKTAFAAVTAGIITGVIAGAGAGIVIAAVVGIGAFAFTVSQHSMVDKARDLVNNVVNQ